MKAMRAWLLPLIALASVAHAEVTLKVGDPAPALSVSRWAKGDPIEKLEAGKTYVLTFWSTWARPSVAALPLMVDLHKQFKDKFVFIGVSSFESDPANVDRLVAQAGPKLDIAVASDHQAEGDTQGDMAKSWLIASGKDTIPFSYIVDAQGKIAWIGNPFDGLREALLQIEAGKFDPVATEKAQEKKEADRKRQQELLEKSEPNKQAKKVFQALREQKFKEAIELAEPLKGMKGDEVVPNPKIVALIYQLNAAAGLQDAKLAHGFADEAVKNLWGEPNGLNEVAWALVGPDSKIGEGNLKIAKKAAERAVDLTKRQVGAILDTLAWANFQLGDVKKAIELEQEALKTDLEDDTRKDLEKSLATFQAKKA